MKVKLLEQEITGFTKSLEIEHEGENYRVDLSYDDHHGYQLQFIGSKGELIATPNWVVDKWDLQEHGSDSYEYELDCATGRWIFTNESEDK